MIAVSGYEITEQIYDGVRAVVYRGRREKDNLPVVVKIHKTDFPSSKEIARFRREVEIGMMFDFKGIIKYYGTERYKNAYALITEDFGAVALAEVIPEDGMDIKTFLQVAIQIAQALGEIHKQHIIHKDIKPRNIAINPETGITKLIDFGISSQLSRENQTVTSPNILEGTLAYISPEQTGRMNRAIDYRTDFYSLGVTFYEMLTGSLPFDGSDPMELVHCHIARAPIPPHERNEEIPFKRNYSLKERVLKGKTVAEVAETSGPFKAVSDMVMKLLAKTAEERYQSANGLAIDLRKCLTAFESNGSIEKIIIGEEDVSARFEIPQKLYGREAEIGTLMAAFARVSGGTKEMMLVSGYSGIGKSALVNEIHKPIVEKRGYFISGKFEQLQRNIPYAALIMAFRGLMRQLLTESEAQIAAWREKLLTALGKNGQIIINVLPELELIIGTQPSVPELPPVESQNRFNLVFQRFVRVFTQREHPLVVFLDDLQWADSASLKAIELFMAEQETQYLFLIGAYRDNEVTDAHPLMLSLERIQKTWFTPVNPSSEAVINQIHLQPLDMASLNQLVAETLAGDIETAKPLAELVMGKTNGNPFFINQFLTSIYEAGLLIFDYDQGSWRWEIAKIEQAEITDNVVDLMVGKIQKLPISTQEVLKLAACIGNQFDLHTTSIIHEKSQNLLGGEVGVFRRKRATSETAEDLWEALQEGLIIPLGDDYKFLYEVLDERKQPPCPPLEGGMGFPFQNPFLQGRIQNKTGDLTPSEAESPDKTELAVSYKFLHDRVQQAAYSLISDDQKKVVHLKIGRLMLLNIPDDKRLEQIFDIVNQLNFGVELITDGEEQYELARLNLTAGKQAKSSAAYQAAEDYFKAGIVFLAKDSWQTQYDLTLALYTEAAEAAYLNGGFEQTEILVEVVLKQAKTLLDKVKVYEIRIQSCLAQNKLTEAVDTGKQALRLLGIRFPRRTSKLHVVVGLLQTKLTLSRKRIEELSDLPEMTAPDKLAAMRILLRISSAVYFTDPKLAPLISLKGVNLSIKHGNAPTSAYSYAGYGLTLCGGVGDINSGYQFGNIALNLLDRFDAQEFKARTSFLVHSFVKHWKEHVGESLQPFLQGYQDGLETGDLEYAAYSVNAYFYYSRATGKELASLEREMAKYSDAIGQLKQEISLHRYRLSRQVVSNLMGRRSQGTAATNPFGLIGEYYNEEQMLPLHQQANDGTAIFMLYSAKLFLCYLFGDYPQALEYVTLAEEYLRGAIGTPGFTIFHFYDSLVRLAVYTSVLRSEQRRILKKVSANQKKMRKWAHHAPMNYQYKFFLVEAERARVLSKDVEAMECYDKAISGAREHEYVNDEALANELAAKFYLLRGKEKIAQTYMMAARYAYERWGATAKVKDLDDRYPQLLERTSVGVRTDIDGTITHATTTEETLGSLDLNTVLKASQTISGEITLETLLAKMMNIVIENAGAQKGCLILERRGKLMIEAEVAVDDDEIHVLQSIPVEGNAEIPEAIINYAARTQESVVLNDAVDEGNFTKERYIVKNQPKSVLCSPLIHQGKLSGILYLENNLTKGAFTPARLEVLNLLSAQAAISIENAHLYENLEQLVDERTEELREKNEALEQTLEQLRATQHQLVMREKMASLGNLVAGVAHEMNNPIGAIHSSADVATRGLRKIKSLLQNNQNLDQPNYDDRQLQRSLNLLEGNNQVITTASDRIAKIVQSLRAFARLDEAAFQKADLHENVDATLTLLHHELRDKAEVIKEYGEIPHIHCYPSELNQVWMNLLRNAVQAIEQEGTIKIVTSADETQVYVCISDTGKGIPPENLPKIFDPGFTTQGGGVGVGLGLSIVYNIIQKHNGDIKVESEIGKGTEFIIILPIEQNL